MCFNHLFRPLFATHWVSQNVLVLPIRVGLHGAFWHKAEMAPPVLGILQTLCAGSPGPRQLQIYFSHETLPRKEPECHEQNQRAFHDATVLTIPICSPLMRSISDSRLSLPSTHVAQSGTALRIAGTRTTAYALPASTEFSSKRDGRPFTQADVLGYFSKT